MNSNDALDRLSIITLDELYDVITKLEESILNSTSETGDSVLDSLVAKISQEESLDTSKSRSKLLNQLKSIKKLELSMSLRPSKALLFEIIRKARSQMGQVVLDIKYDQNIFAGFEAIYEGKKYNYALDRNINLD